MQGNKQHAVATISKNMGDGFKGRLINHDGSDDSGQGNVGDGV